MCTVEVCGTVTGDAEKKKTCADGANLKEEDAEKLKGRKIKAVWPCQQGEKEANDAV